MMEVNNEIRPNLILASEESCGAESGEIMNIKIEVRAKMEIQGNKRYRPIVRMKTEGLTGLFQGRDIPIFAIRILDNPLPLLTLLRRFPVLDNSLSS